MRMVLSLLVENTSGVLSRVSGLFSRRGYNITSLTVGETADPRYSRMTVVAEGDEQILDQIRKMDWIPRTIRQKQKKIECCIREIEQATGHAASDEEIAKALGITDDEFLEWQSQMKITGLVSLNEFMEQGSDVSQDYSRHTTAQFVGPEENIEQAELTQMLGEALKLLTEKEQKVITLYYYEELTLKEISNILEVSESRVSQLHTRALQKMKTKMGNYMGILTG